MQKVIPVDVNAVFNTLGELKPRYIRVENEEHELITCKIEEVKTVEKTKVSGFGCYLFKCSILNNGKTEEINLRYVIDMSAWQIIQ